MLPLSTRRRPFVLLVAVVVGQVLLLATQIKREHDVRLIRSWAVAVLTPFQRAGAYVIDSIGSSWNNYLGLRSAHRENEALHKEVADLKLRLQLTESRAREADRLATLLAFRETHSDAALLAARVIATSPGGNSERVYLNRGERDGVRKDMGVITPDGVVGKILETYPHTAQVLLVTDQESGVGSRLAESRAAGVVRGTGGPVLALHYVVNEQEVAQGERIVTSGQDRIFPKDLPVGTVMDTRAGSTFKAIRVRPAARLDQLEEVFILMTRQEWETSKQTETKAGQPESSPPKGSPEPN